MKEWKAWETETQTLEYQYTHGTYDLEVAKMSGLCSGWNESTFYMGQGGLC